MTALLEIKQNIKRFYGEYEVYILPVLKFALAFVYFLWINSNMGYMKQLDNIFVILVLALVCAILPVSVMMFIGFAMMIGHCYAVGPEVAGFMLVLILFMMILFLRFSGSQNITLILTPLSFGFSVPTLLPLGAGLLGSAVSALPAGCGDLLFYPFCTCTVRGTQRSGNRNCREAETAFGRTGPELGYVDHSDCFCGCCITGESSQNTLF